MQRYRLGAAKSIAGSHLCYDICPYHPDRVPVPLYVPHISESPVTMLLPRTSIFVSDTCFITNTIIWGYNNCRDRNPSHVQRWIPITAEQDPPLSPNKVIQQILLPASFARGYREQQQRYSTPI
jgi:hypothetical protein